MTDDNMTAIPKIKMILSVHRKLLASVFVLCSAAILIVSLLSPRVYELQTSVYVHKKIPTAQSSINLPDFAGPNLTDHVKVMTSAMVLGDLSEKLSKEFPEKNANPGELMKRLRIVSAKNTKVIHLSYQDSDREFAKSVLDGILVSYEKALSQINNDTKKKSITFLEKRIAKISKERREVAAKMETLQAESGTTDINIKNSELLKIQTDYKVRMSELNANIASTRNELKQLEKNLNLKPDQITALMRIKEDPQLKAWQGNLATLHTELSDLRSVYTDKYSAVIEKKAAIEQTQNLIANRVSSMYDKPFKEEQLHFSDVDEALGKNYIVKNIEYFGMLGQKSQYATQIAGLHSDFGTLATNKRQIDDLRFKFNSLESEEKKLISRLNDDEMDQGIINNLGTFSVISPAVIPSNGSYIFPLRVEYAVITALVVGLIMALFAVAMVEYLNPRVIDLDTIPVITEISRFGKALKDAELKDLYQNLSVLIKKNRLRTVSIVHMCGADSGSGITEIDNESVRYAACPYSPSVFARQISTMFSERGKKTLLVDWADAYDSDIEARECIAQVLDFSLYCYPGMDNLHILSPNRSGGNIYVDPHILDIIPDSDQYELVFFNSSLSEKGAIAGSVCDIADGTIVGVSKLNTPTKTLRTFQRTAEEGAVNLIGSILFP